MVPLSSWLKRDEVKIKWCSRSTPVQTLQQMPQPTLQPMLSLKPQLMSLAPSKMHLPMQVRTLEPSLPQFRPTVLRAVSVVGYEMKWR
jgi:hypothetical protein